jgi:hypothetical protein
MKFLNNNVTANGEKLNKYSIKMILENCYPKEPLNDSGWW